jgi:hypothetical protein
LTEQQSAELKSLAQQERVSVAEIIRRSIDLYVDARHEPSREMLKQRSLEIVGKYASGASDVSVNHDAYLDEIYGDFGS